MKKNEKRMILIIILVGVVIVGGLLFAKNANKEGKKEVVNKVEEQYVQVLEDGTKLNNSNKLSETKKIDGMEITGIQLAHQDGVSRVIATVTNKTNQDKGLTRVTLTLLDNKNNVLEKVNGLISPVKAGESVQLNIGLSADYANAYDFKIEKR